MYVNSLWLCVVLGTSLDHFYVPNMSFSVSAQLALILVLPLLLQWSLGGFAASGAVMIWSILSPIGAIMFA